ncbi:hypothetical protein VNO78_24795 [Psophocarpus tetragonolobus]|uniref:Uncharacterized protein n=1 Tax=Psophocarpus tetragonolobus TaxID=3891 RepID=A0AAN9S5W3_PSOTE
MPWNTLMDKMMMELYSHGKTLKDIQEALRKIPLHPRVIPATQAAHALRIIYLGDGIGDYCPSLRLKEKDFMVPRRNFLVWGLIFKDPLLVKAGIHGWIDGEEQEQMIGAYRRVLPLFVGNNWFESFLELSRIPQHRGPVVEALVANMKSDMHDAHHKVVTNLTMTWLKA